MAGYYIHMPSPVEPGGLTAKELVYAHMPCHFGEPDCANGKFLYESRFGDERKAFTEIRFWLLKQTWVRFLIAVSYADMH